MMGEGIGLMGHRGERDLSDKRDISDLRDLSDIWDVRDDGRQMGRCDLCDI